MAIGLLTCGHLSRDRPPPQPASVPRARCRPRLRRAAGRARRLGRVPAAQVAVVRHPAEPVDRGRSGDCPRGPDGRRELVRHPARRHLRVGHRGRAGARRRRRRHRRTARRHADRVGPGERQGAGTADLDSGLVHLAAAGPGGRWRPGTRRGRLGRAESRRAGHAAADRRRPRLAEDQAELGRAAAADDHGRRDEDRDRRTGPRRVRPVRAARAAHRGRRGRRQRAGGHRRRAARARGGPVHAARRPARPVPAGGRPGHRGVVAVRRAAAGAGGDHVQRRAAAGTAGRGLPRPGTVAAGLSVRGPARQPLGGRRGGRTAAAGVDRYRLQHRARPAQPAQRRRYRRPRVHPAARRAVGTPAGRRGRRPGPHPADPVHLDRGHPARPHPRRDGRVRLDEHTGGQRRQRHPGTGTGQGGGRWTEPVRRHVGGRAVDLLDEAGRQHAVQGTGTHRPAGQPAQPARRRARRDPGHAR